MRISPNRVYLYLCTQEYLSCQPCPHISIQLVALYFDDVRHCYCYCVSNKDCISNQCHPDDAFRDPTLADPLSVIDLWYNVSKNVAGLNNVNFTE